jgi:hypothetical protein
VVAQTQSQQTTHIRFQLIEGVPPRPIVHTARHDGLLIVSMPLGIRTVDALRVTRDLCTVDEADLMRAHWGVPSSAELPDPTDVCVAITPVLIPSMVPRSLDCRLVAIDPLRA